LDFKGKKKDIVNINTGGIIDTSILLKNINLSEKRSKTPLTIYNGTNIME
jgi:hypothetical protein